MNFRSMILPAVTALLLIATLPPFSAGLLIFVALIPFLVFLERVRGRESFFRMTAWGSAVAGLPYASVSLWPLVSARAWWWVGRYSFLWKNKEVLLAIFLLIVALLTGALLFFILSVVYRKVRAAHIPRWVQAGVIAVAWSAFEYVRMLALGGIIWQEFAFSLAPYSWLRVFVGPLGLYGTEIAIVLVNIAGAWVVISVYRAIARVTGGWMVVMGRLVRYVFGMGVGAALIVGLFTLSTDPRRASTESSEAVPVRVAAIQSPFVTEDALGFVAQDFFEQTVRSLGETDLVVLPENAIPYFVLDEKTGKPVDETPQVAAWFDRFMKISRERPLTTFIIGFHSKNSEESLEKNYNSLALIQNGTVLDFYHKRYLLPLSELSPNIGPLRSLEPLNVGERGQGGESAFVSPHGILWPLICSEVFNAHTWRANPFPATTPTVTVYSGNETVFASPLVADRIKMISQMRAVYEHTYIIASVKGAEARIIDPTGAVRTVSGPEHVATTTLWLHGR
jgi:apolipoprotein N-acyltransferase